MQDPEVLNENISGIDKISNYGQLQEIRLKPNTDPQLILKNIMQFTQVLMFEIARMSNRFQKKCAMNTTAEYVLREDGRLDVINRCFDPEGEEIKATGIAKIVDTESNAKLKVSFVSIFGINLFWGDYWVIGLDAQYNWAIVGDPGKKYGWILSRERQVSESERMQIDAILQENGYNPAKFISTMQN